MVWGGVKSRWINKASQNVIILTFLLRIGQPTSLIPAFGAKCISEILWLILPGWPLGPTDDISLLLLIPFLNWWHKKGGGFITILMLSRIFFFLRSENSHFNYFSFSRILTLGLGFLIIPFLPASNLFFRVGFVVAERVLYLPSAGYCMLLTFGFGALSKHTKKKVLAQSGAVHNRDD